MRTPRFWYARNPGPWPVLLSPLAAVYGAATRFRQALGQPHRAAAPVICVGNVVAGGAGKTPVVHALAHAAIARGLHPAVISRGYGGTKKAATRVDPTVHTAHDVGDEALLSAAIAPTWVGNNRAASATAATAAGADLLILDDGFQNPRLSKDFSILVFDGTRGIGNGRMIPAGPLRQTLNDGVRSANAAVIIGGTATDLVRQVTGIPIYTARLDPIDLSVDRSLPVIAFAGIGNPDKFFATLRDAGCTLMQTYAFPDHHTYTPEEIDRLVDAANTDNTPLLTTTKDAARLSEAQRKKVIPVPVQLTWDAPSAAEEFIDRATAAFTANH